MLMALLLIFLLLLILTAFHLILDKKNNCWDAGAVGTKSDEIMVLLKYLNSFWKTKKKHLLVVKLISF